MSLFQLAVRFTINPNVMFLRPDVLWVSQWNVRPKFGIASLVMSLFICLSKYGSEPSEYGETPCAVADDIDSAGVKVSCEYFATALPAGLMDMLPRSPPRAVNAFPIAIVLAVPS